MMKIADPDDVFTYYVFLLTDELYAVDIERIKEVKVGYDKTIHPVSGFKSSMAGFIDLDGKEVPVLDLNSILPVAPSSHQIDSHTIIIVQLMRDKQKKECGLLVDTCLNVTNITVRDALPVPRFEPYVNKYFISKAFHEDKEIIKILDIDTLWAKTTSFDKTKEDRAD